MSFQQNRNQTTSYISDDDFIFITLLTSMYNDNTRQINSLTNANNQIRNAILNIINRTNVSGHQNYFDSTRTNQNQNQANMNNSTSLTRNLLSNVFQLSNNNLNQSIPNTNNRNTFNTRIFETFFDPVYINPTPAQIETATRNLRFGDIIRPMNTSCPISLEAFNDNSRVTMIRYCGHLFNPDEINIWFRSNCRCPICRYDIRTYNPSSYNRNNNTNNSETANDETSENTNTDSDASNNNVQNSDPVTPTGPPPLSYATPPRAPLNRRQNNLNTNTNTNTNTNGMSDEEYSRRILALIFGENGTNNVSDIINGYTFTR